MPAEPERDDFDATALSPRWISPRSRPPHAWSLTERPGWLTLRATGGTLDRPGGTFLGRRQQHHDVRVAARLDPGTGRGGLSVPPTVTARDHMTGDPLGVVATGFTSCSAGRGERTH
ncbi:hypothetical protein [Nonomuraea sp. 10N515B]|uniref:beta-xylosidase family glycoside hydrolase n=1 Tax=Nonomuraea sp. 10N515B TaxID=3457422 RepID=UPI003FCE3F9A